MFQQKFASSSLKNINSNPNSSNHKTTKQQQI